MKTRNAFHPECTVQHVRLTGKNTAIVQVAVSYDRGIALEDGDRIPPFSEIHKLVLVRIDDAWRISTQDDAPGAEDVVELQDAERVALM